MSSGFLPVGTVQRLSYDGVKKGSKCTEVRFKTTSKTEVNIRYANHLLNLTA